MVADMHHERGEGGGSQDGDSAVGREWLITVAKQQSGSRQNISLSQNKPMCFACCVICQPRAYHHLHDMSIQLITSLTYAQTTGHFEVGFLKKSSDRAGKWLHES
jgi:hypothetical protein